MICLSTTSFIQPKEIRLNEFSCYRVYLSENDLTQFKHRLIFELLENASEALKTEINAVEAEAAELDRARFAVIPFIVRRGENPHLTFRERALRRGASAFILPVKQQYSIAVNGNVLPDLCPACPRYVEGRVCLDKRTNPLACIDSGLFSIADI